MSNGEFPEGLMGWVLTSVGAVMATLVTTIATLWKVGESKNAKAIEEQRKETEQQKIEFASHRAELATEIRAVRENLKVTEEARLECERDRASLTAKCEIFETRLSRLENQA